MQLSTHHPAPLDERCDECDKYLLRTFDRSDRDLCAGHVGRLA
jgi:hypothetical protein